jgi:hypothetical protein
MEIGLVVLTVLTGVAQDPFLPAPLRAYEQERLSSGLGLREWLTGGLAVVVLGLLVAAWIALWRGARRGRALYTAGWVCSILFEPLLGPTVNAGHTSALTAASNVVGGLILGLLYFSDLRFRYEHTLRERGRE